MTHSALDFLISTEVFGQWHVQSLHAALHNSPDPLDRLCILDDFIALKTVASALDRLDTYFNEYGLADLDLIVWGLIATAHADLLDSNEKLNQIDTLCQFITQAQ